MQEALSNCGFALSAPSCKTCNLLYVCKVTIINLRIVNTCCIFLATVVTASSATIYCITLVSEADPWKIGKRVWDVGWGGSVPNGMYGICNY